MHSQNYSQIRKKSFKHACKKVAVSQRPVSYRVQPLTPTMLRRTQIDFILTREISAGRQAKQASPLLDFLLGSWKKGGHRPIQAFVTPVRHWNLPGPKIKPLQRDSAALQEAVRANSPQAHAEDA